MKYVALICARGGSKGVPGKNIKPLAGVPLIGWSIKVAKKISRISRLIVSTDSPEIADVAKEMGAEVPFIRPAELAKDDSPEWQVWRHSLGYLAGDDSGEYQGLVVLPPTAPLRTVDDVERCIDVYENENPDIVIAVSDSHRNPYFNMVRLDRDGNASLVIPPENNIFRRQDVPVVYDMTTVAYVARPDFVLQRDGLFSGTVKTVNVPVENAIDIDTELDFKIAEFFANEREIEKNGNN